MNRCAIVLLMLLIGCGGPPPKVRELPKDTVRVKEGAIDPDAPQEFTTTESGLKYRILRKSDGRKPTPTDKVRVHYRGRFNDENGKIFDSSYGSSGESANFSLGGVIKGWTEGLQLVGEGGMIELIIPPELAYGDQGTPGMPPNSTLHFIVELIEVK